MEIALVYNYTRKMYKIVCRTGLLGAREKEMERETQWVGEKRREIANKPRRGLNV